MTIQDDLTQVAGSRDSDAAIVDFWSAAQYGYRTLCESIQKMEEAAGRADLSACPTSIKQQGAAVLDELKALRELLEENHSKFLSWEPPQ